MTVGILFCEEPDSLIFGSDDIFVFAFPSGCSGSGEHFIFGFHSFS